MNTQRQEIAEFLQLYLEGSWKLIKLYEQVFRDSLNRYSLTKNEKDVLLFLHNNPLHDTATDIVKYRSISKSLVCKSVDSLISKGHLQEHPDEKDRRVIHLSLTPEVEKVAKELYHAQQGFFDILSKDIAPAEYTQLSQLIKRVIDNAEKHMPY